MKRRQYNEPMPSESRDVVLPKLVAAGPADLDDILALLNDCGLPTEGVADHLKSFVSVHHGSRLIGCAGLELYGTAALLRSVAVAKGWRERGLGQKLTHAALARARDLGVRKIFLLTEGAASYFQKLGFEELARSSVDPDVRRSVEFVSACPDTARAMVLDILDG